MRAVPIALGGFTGALVDSMLGATVQEVRFCDACAVETEERVHRCGAQPSRVTRGASWCDNDMVNGIATAVGADGHPRPARLPRSAAGEVEEQLSVLTRQGGERVEYIGRVTIRPGTDRAAFNVRFGTAQTSCSPDPRERAGRWETFR